MLHAATRADWTYPMVLRSLRAVVMIGGSFDKGSLDSAVPVTLSLRKGREAAALPLGHLSNLGRQTAPVTNS